MWSLLSFFISMVNISNERLSGVTVSYHYVNKKSKMLGTPLVLKLATVAEGSMAGRYLDNSS